MSVLLGKSFNKDNRLNESRNMDTSMNHSAKKSLWSKYTNHGGPMSRTYSLALNNSRAINKPRSPGLINCIKTIIEHNKKKVITPDNALTLFGTSIVTNPQGKRGYGTTFSMVKILRPQVKRHPKPTTEDAKQKLLQKRQRLIDNKAPESSLNAARP
jgi:hypothetical protein